MKKYGPRTFTATIWTPNDEGDADITHWHKEEATMNENQLTKQMADARKEFASHAKEDDAVCLTINVSQVHL